jgi:hypothetical protein
LGFWDLGSGHAFCNGVFIDFGVSDAIGCSNIPPQMKIDIAVDDSVIVEVHLAEVALGVGASLFRC